MNKRLKTKKPMDDELKALFEENPDIAAWVEKVLKTSDYYDKLLRENGFKSMSKAMIARQVQADYLKQKAIEYDLVDNSKSYDNLHDDRRKVVIKYLFPGSSVIRVSQRYYATDGPLGQFLDVVWHDCGRDSNLISAEEELALLLERNHINKNDVIDERKTK